MITPIRSGSIRGRNIQYFFFSTTSALVLVLPEQMAECWRQSLQHATEHILQLVQGIRMYEFIPPLLQTGIAVARWLRCSATNRKVTGSIPAGVSGFFIDIKSFRSHYGPGADSVSNINEYQEYFLGLKAAGA